ncbi:intracellular hyaluronan-binding protein 4-like isoform X2 [Eucyclogobius newberryi]|uniref:intracellular hyaluronan-binding protein 4-like isoform X2 n=1 Tax=Eucyclogobius newberryi TaxID=166745 RepID=UPI003B5A1470
MLPDEYGCAVANRFGELLDDEADPFDILNEAGTDKDKQKKNKNQEDVKNRHKKPGQKESQKNRRALAEAPEPVPVRKLQSRAGSVTERAEKEEGQRGTKRAAYGERRNYSDNALQEFSVPRPSYEDVDVRGRGGYGGGGRGGGGRGGCFIRNPETFNLRGKREYDRHNGTGISPEEKRGGRGAWNWGSVNEATSEMMEVTEAAPVKSEEPQFSADEENLGQQEEEGEMVVHVAVEMSLDEWKALQEVNRPKVEFNIRKAEDKIPSKAKVIHESKHLEVLDELDEEGTFLRRSVNDITSLLDINFGSLGRPSRGGRGRGGPRGGIRGGSTVQTERMKPILEVGDHLAPNPYDPEDFPALSAGP